MRAIFQILSLSLSVFLFCNILAPTFSMVLSTATLNSVTPTSVIHRKTDAAITSPYSISFLKTNGNIGTSSAGVNSNHKMTSKIHSSLKSPNEGASDMKGLNDLAQILVDEQDNLENTDQSTKDIYHGVVDLFALKMQNWLASKENNINSISQYLGYPKDVIQVINSSMTELLAQQHKKQIDLLILLNMFYYTCDIEKFFEDDITKVKDMFKGFLRKFGFPEQNKNNGDDQMKTETDRIVNKLLENLPNSHHPAVTVSIPAMKNHMMIDESKNEQIEKLKDRFVENYGTVAELAKSYAKETNGEKVSNNHADIMSKLASDILGYAYNHVELLESISNLGTEVDISIEKIHSIDRFKSFFNGFANVFINRIFYFKTNGEMNQTVLNDMFSVIDFFNQRSDDLVDSNNQNIKDFYEHPEKRAELIKYMRQILNKLVEDLLKVSGSNETITEWKERCTVKLIYPEEFEKNAGNFINVIEGNITDAFDLIGTFTEDFDYGVNRYREFGFNLEEWPEYIF